MPPNERELNAKLKMRVDEQSAGEVKRGAQQAERDLKKVEERLNRIREAGDQLTQVGTRVAALGAAMTGPFLLAARNYIQYAGRAESTSRRWIAATDRLQRAQMRIGRVAAQQLTPFLEKAADLAEKTTNFIEEHPEVLKAVLSVGGILAAGGGLAALVGDISATLVVASSLAGKLGLLGGGAAAAGGAAAGGAAAAGAAGAGGAAIGGAAISGIAFAAAAVGMVRTEITKEVLRVLGIDDKSMLGSFITAGLDISGIGGIMQSIEQLSGVDVGGAVHDLFGLSEAIEKISESTGDVKGEIISQAALDAYADYQQSIKDIEREVGEARSEIVRQYGDDLARIEEQYGDERTRIVRDFARQQAEAQDEFDRQQQRAQEDFARSEAQIEQDYYDNRAKRARDFGTEVARMEEDHQRAMRRMREDHQVREMDLIGSRDALGLARERRNYERDRQRAEEDYRVQAGRRHADYAREMADMEKHFAEAREQRLEDFERRRKEEQEDFDLRREKEIEHHEEMLAEMEERHRDELRELRQQRDDALRILDEQHRAELIRLQNAFTAQLRAFDIHLGRERSTANRYYALMEADFRNWLGKMRSSMGGYIPPTTGGGSGRKVPPVNIPQTGTGQTPGVNIPGARQLIPIQAMAMASGRAGNQVTVGQIQFHGSFSDAERQWFRNMAEGVAASVVDYVVN